MRTSMEGCIQLIAERKGIKNGTLRQAIDIVLVVLSVALTVIFTVDWSAGGFMDIMASGTWRLREGTIIAALIFGPAMDLLKKPIQKLLLALKITSAEEFAAKA